MTFRQKVTDLWQRPNGYRDVLNIGLPLVVSMGSVTVMQFTDQIFLAKYSLNSVAAAMPSGIASFLFTAFFIGVAGYTNVFVAQYSGSGQREKIGASLWQGIWFSLLAGLCLLGVSLLGRPLFALGGHPSEIQDLETVYFQIMTAGSGVRVLAMSLSCFYSGQGRTRPVMIISVIAAGLNIPLDYAMINGRWFFPEMGIAGAGVATVTASVFNLAMYAVLIFTRDNNRRFAVWSARAFDRELFGRMMRYGLPGGVQFFIDIFAFTCFVFIVGRLGKAQLAASNIAIAINHLAFMPIIGLSIATSTLVGMAVGRGRPTDGIRATASTLHLSLVYMALCAAVFLLAPEWLAGLFTPRDMDPADFAPLVAMCVILLRFVAAYTILDALAIIYAAAIKGAGDSRFVMWATAGMSMSLLVIPTLVGLEFLGWGVNAAFLVVNIYVVALALVFWARFKQGRWQSMRVIETTTAPAGEPGKTPPM